MIKDVLLVIRIKNIDPFTKDNIFYIFHRVSLSGFVRSVHNFFHARFTRSFGHFPTTHSLLFRIFILFTHLNFQEVVVKIYRQ